MSDEEFDEAAFRAYEDELYQEDSSVTSEDELDSEIEEALYGNVHYASSLILPESVENSAEGNELCNAEKTFPSKEKPHLYLDTKHSTVLWSQKSSWDCAATKSYSSGSDSDSTDEGKAETTVYPEVLEIFSSDDKGSKTQRHGTNKNTVNSVIVVNDSTSELDDSDSNLKLGQEQGGADENWELDGKDLGLPRTGGRPVSRYYKPTEKTGKRCFNCNEKGHLTNSCPEPRKISSCYLCGLPGHVRRHCPAELCFNCDEPGHQSRNCRKPRRRRFDSCQRCFSSGHIQSDCPDQWRQYHITTQSGKVVTPTKPNGKPTGMFCYNCSKQGHYGHECTEDPMDGNSAFSLPFVVQYDGSPSFHHQDRLFHRHPNNQKRHSWPQESEKQRLDQRTRDKQWRQQQKRDKKWRYKQMRDDQSRREVEYLPKSGERTVEVVTSNEYPRPSSNRKRNHGSTGRFVQSDEPTTKKKKKKKRKRNDVPQRSVEVLNYSDDGHGSGLREEPRTSRRKWKSRRGGKHLLGQQNQESPCGSTPSHPKQEHHHFVSERGFSFGKMADRNKNKSKRYTQ